MAKLKTTYSQTKNEDSEHLSQVHHRLIRARWANARARNPPSTVVTAAMRPVLRLSDARLAGWVR